MSSSMTPEQWDAIKNSPAMQPPAGVQPNSADPVNQNQPFLIVSSLLLGIMAVFIMNRAYSKLWITRRYSWDDLTIILAVIGSVAYYVACVWGAQRGKMGVHLWDIRVWETSISDLTIPSYLIAVLTPPTMLFTKITFFIMYLSLFRPMSWMRICANIGTVLTSLFYGGMFLAQIIIRTPRAGETMSTRLQKSSVANDSLALSVPQSAVGLAIDLYILILPIIAVSQLQLPLRRKIGTSLIFATGSTACVSSLLSIYYRQLLNETPDMTWALMPVNTVTLVEMFVGIISACMPSAAQSCRHHLPHYDYEALWMRLSPPFQSLRSRHKRSQPSSSSSSDLEKNHGGITVEGPYLDLKSHKLAKHSDLLQTKGIRTFIQGGRQDSFVDNTI